MMGLFSNLFTRNEPVLSEASSRDAAAIAALHAASFARGWSEQEVEGLLTDRHVIAHRAMVGSVMAGFIMSRLVEDEAEILSIAVAGSRRGRGLARNLLTLHLRRLAGLGARAVFPGSRRTQCRGDPALRPRRIPRNIPPPQLLPGRRRQGGRRAGAAPRSGLAHDPEKWAPVSDKIMRQAKTPG